jgi:hypothetical protein
MTSRNNEQSGAFLARLIEKRSKLIDALDANKGEVNLDIFEDFYPDRAHFVYEILQNAEDAGATQVTFTLEQGRLICEHDGRRAFTEDDVSAITGIHNSTKGRAQDRIGKFGVGFKSVFVYTQSPTVRSGDYSFRIVKLILPEAVEPDPSVGSRTRFEFPFDNPAKPPTEAYEEIATGLNDLDETTLLFLTNLRSIKWQIGEAESSEIVRHMHADPHFEIVKQGGGQAASSSHFLKFGQVVPGLGTHRVAVAFPLEFLQGVRQFDAGKPLAVQLRIVPAKQGRVAVFFPAAKETSGLLFHLHGPFVPELSRASIKETPANEPLFEQLAELCARALHPIKELGLLTPELLAILPNPQDQLPARYQPVRSAIIAEMKCHALTPTQARGHAAAKNLVQAKASLKSLLSHDDLEFLLEYDDVPPRWAIGAAQRSSRIDNFLSGLEIQEWAIEAFVKTIADKTYPAARYSYIRHQFVSGPDQQFMDWLMRKPADWLQQFYALLHDEAVSLGLSSLKSLKLVRLNDGSFGVPAECFFANDQTTDHISIVDPGVYSSGKSKPQQEKAKKFLSDIGVRELGEAEEIELILKARYTTEEKRPDDGTYLRDLKRFVGLIERQPEKQKLFASYYILQGEDESWYMPGNIYLDQPYRLTDLSAYFGKITEDVDCVALHPRYMDCGIAPKRLTAFAEAIGSRTTLAIEQGWCSGNPQWPYLRAVGGERDTSPVNRDYFIPKLVELLKKPSLELSRLVWRTLVSIPPSSEYFQATFRRNLSGGTRYADSRLMHELRASKWVPQCDGVFVRPAEASRQLLPEGFPFDAGNVGLKAVQFEADASRQAEQEQSKDNIAKRAGFADSGTLERAKRFAALPQEEQERFFAELERAAKSAVSDRDPINPERRSRNVAEQAAEAPDKTSEIRDRSVSVGREEVKVAAEEYLRQHYRNADGDMTCQVCKGPLPFKLDDGSEFFEIVELLPELEKRHFQNYIALCPNHSAMYRHANGSKDVIRGMVEKLSGNELDVVIAQRDMTIYLSTIHVIDLKAVLEAEAGHASNSEDDRAA